MNYNHPFFKQIQKISRYFNVKPVFVDYDMNDNKVVLAPYKKRIHDDPNLVLINNVPCSVAYNLYKRKAKKITDNIFASYKKNNGVISYGLHSIEGDILAIGTYHPKAKETKVQTVNEGTDYESMVVLSGSKQEIINKLIEFKERHKKDFSL